MSEIFNEITEERSRQDQQWGGSEHDDTHDSLDFTMFIQLQALKHNRAFVRNKHIECRERLIKIAALAVAAVESMDRRHE
jgi:hypothetical protein